MTPERVTPMTDEEIRYFAELEVDLGVDDSPTVRVEISTPNDDWKVAVRGFVILFVIFSAIVGFWAGLVSLVIWLIP